MGIKTVKPTGFQEFTASGSFTVPAGVTLVYVSGCAGGGGSVSNGTDAPSIGGAGRSVVRKPMAVTPGAVLPVVVGAAGGTGLSGGSTTFNGMLLKGGAPGISLSGGAFMAQIGQSSPWGCGTLGTGFGFGVGGGTNGSSQSVGTAGYLIIEW